VSEETKLPFRCYECKTEFDQKRAPGEYAVCPNCWSQDIVHNDNDIKTRTSI